MLRIWAFNSFVCLIRHCHPKSAKEKSILHILRVRKQQPWELLWCKQYVADTWQARLTGTKLKVKEIFKSSYILIFTNLFSSSVPQSESFYKVPLNSHFTENSKQYSDLISEMRRFKMRIQECR